MHSIEISRPVRCVSMIWWIRRESTGTLISIEKRSVCAEKNDLALGWFLNWCRLLYWNCPVGELSLLTVLYHQVQTCAVTTMATALSCVCPHLPPAAPACAPQDTAWGADSSPVRVRTQHTCTPDIQTLNYVWLPFGKTAWRNNRAQCLHFLQRTAGNTIRNIQRGSKLHNNIIWIL